MIYLCSRVGVNCLAYTYFVSLFEKLGPEWPLMNEVIIILAHNDAVIPHK